MLAKTPKAASAGVIDLFEHLGGISIDDFRVAAPSFAPLKPFDFRKTEYREYKKSDGTVIEGIFNKISGEPDGIVRVAQNNGSIREAQFRDGQKHGFERAIVSR